MTEQRGATGPPIAIDRPAGQPTNLPKEGNMRVVELPQGQPRHDQPQQQKATLSSSQQKGQPALPGPPVQKDVVAEAVRALTLESKRDVAAEAVQALPLETKKEVAAEAVINLSPEAKKDVAAQAISTLSSEDREDLAQRIQPSQIVADRIWQIIVWAFAGVFVLSTLAFFLAALWRPDNIELLLTVVTTIAGILAGFISGRSSAGGSGR
jgi:hypothetical protein